MGILSQLMLYLGIVNNMNALIESTQKVWPCLTWDHNHSPSHESWRMDKSITFFKLMDWLRLARKGNVDSHKSRSGHCWQCCHERIEEENGNHIILDKSRIHNCHTCHQRTNWIHSTLERQILSSLTRPEWSMEPNKRLRLKMLSLLWEEIINQNKCNTIKSK